MNRLVTVFVSALLAAPAPAQLRPLPRESVPPEVLLETIRSAYDKKPTADEVKVTLLKGSHSPVASDTFIIRIDPGTSGPAPARVFIDFGTLRVVAASGEVTAANELVPGKYFQSTLSGPITPRSLAKVIPPTPIPELALVSSDHAVVADLTPYTSHVTWTSATIDASARTAMLVGTSSAGPIALTVNPTTGRLSRLTATIHGQGGETTLDLVITPADLGNPGSWGIPVEGRERVKSLADLRTPQASAQPASVGQPVPDLSAQRTDFSPWSVHRALADPPAIPLALILYRATPPERLEAASRDARAGAAVIRAVQFGQTSPGDPPAAPVDLKLAAAVAMELGQFSRAAFDREQGQWQSAAATRSADAHPVASPELLWANSVAQSIDRFDSKSGSILLLIAPDRKLLSVIPLDGRAADPAGLARDVRAALRPSATP
jgi:hypothetical protein